MVTALAAALRRSAADGLGRCWLGASRRLRRPGRWAAPLLSMAILGADGAGGQVAPGTAQERGGIFAEQAAASGLDFVHFNGMSGERYYVEIMGSGVAVLDYDGDGDLDVFLPQGQMLGPAKSPAAAIFPPTSKMLPLRGRLYRNDLVIPPGAESPAVQFVDVTEQSGIRAFGYGMGAAAGDIDNDGWPDLYLTNAGPNQLWRNQRDGTFVEATPFADTGDQRWSLSASFFDFDRDGWLDLYVTNYVDFSVAEHRGCRAMTGAPDYCGPQAYHAVADRLFHNQGDGTFEDVSERSGIGLVEAPGMGVVAGDFDADGWTDLYVANDAEANLLWRNRGDGTFEDRALVSGSAVNRSGQPEAGMGIALGDYDGDGDEDLLVGHLSEETNTLYRSDGAGSFEDLSAACGLGAPSWASTVFGVGWIDVDNDGRLDLLTVAGGVMRIQRLAAAGDLYPLGMTNQLFHNDGEGRFREVTAEAGGAFALTEVSRGLALGDLDNDGDWDAVISNNSGPVQLLFNRRGQSSHWAGLRILERVGGRDASGARVELTAGDGSAHLRRVRVDGSYLSSGDPRVGFGLGTTTGTVQVRVRWPSGGSLVFSALVDRFVTVARGSGAVPPTGATR